MNIPEISLLIYCDECDEKVLIKSNETIYTFLTEHCKSCGHGYHMIFQDRNEAGENQEDWANYIQLDIDPRMWQDWSDGTRLDVLNDIKKDVTAVALKRFLTGLTARTHEIS